MPEEIRLKVGGISSAQFSVYDEFARNIPGFQPMTERDAALLLPKATAPVIIYSWLRYSGFVIVIFLLLLLLLLSTAGRRCCWCCGSIQ